MRKRTARPRRKEWYKEYRELKAGAIERPHLPELSEFLILKHTLISNG